MLHTGDFKMDQLPLDGRLTDLRAFARLGEAGVDLFMVDSTNAEVPGFTTSEREIAPVLDRVFAQARRRIIVASFASHVHRVQQVLDAAQAHGRKVALVGRSMVRNMGVARDLGYLHVPDGLVVDMKEVDDLPGERVVLMCTGSQGEPMAALSRMANRDHRVTVGPDDTVVLASSLIPGNENAVYRVINGLTRLGANVVHKGNARVHVSGHASAGELLYCYNIVRPAQRDAGARRGPAPRRERRAGRQDRRAARARGDRRGRRGRRPRRRRGPRGRRGASAATSTSTAPASARSPTPTSRTGGSSARRGSSPSSWWSTRAPARWSRGPRSTRAGFAEDDTVFDRVKPRIADALAEAATGGVGDVYQLQQVVRRVVGRWVNESYRRRPMIIPLVVEA